MTGVQALSSVVEHYLDTVGVSSSTLLVPTNLVESGKWLVISSTYRLPLITDRYFDKMLSKNFAVTTTTTTRLNGGTK